MVLNDETVANADACEINFLAHVVTLTPAMYRLQLVKSYINLPCYVPIGVFRAEVLPIVNPTLAALWLVQPSTGLV